jgi:MFS family permease
VAPEPAAWATALALLITGLGSIPAILRLQRHSVRERIAAPYRAFVLGSLAAGALAGAIGAVIALYALGTVLLGAGLTDWQLTARTGAVVFVIGGVIAGIYGWIASREHAFTLIATRAPAGAAEEPAPAPRPDTVEAVLDAFAAGNMSREEAASQIHEIDRRHLLPA